MSKRMATRSRRSSSRSACAHARVWHRPHIRAASSACMCWVNHADEETCRRGTRPYQLMSPCSPAASTACNCRRLEPRRVKTQRRVRNLPHTRRTQTRFIPRHAAPVSGTMWAPPRTAVPCLCTRRCGLLDAGGGGGGVFLASACGTRDCLTGNAWRRSCGTRRCAWHCVDRAGLTYETRPPADDVVEERLHVELSRVHDDGTAAGRQWSAPLLMLLCRILFQQRLCEPLVVICRRCTQKRAPSWTCCVIGRGRQQHAPLVVQLFPNLAHAAGASRPTSCVDPQIVVGSEISLPLPLPRQANRQTDAATQRADLRCAGSVGATSNTNSNSVLKGRPSKVRQRQS